MAAFLDGKVEGAERAAVERHLASCSSCYEIFLETSRTEAELEGTDAISAVRGTAWWRHPIAWVAAAAAIVAAVVGLGRLGGPDDEAAEQLTRLLAISRDHRITEARLSDVSAWAPAPSPTRGGTTDVVPLEIQRIGSELDALAHSNRSATTLRSVAISLIARGRVDDAIEALSDALAISPGDEGVAIDLSASLLERARLTGSTSMADAERALGYVDAVLGRRPDLATAVFNRALALEALGRRQPAAEAWRQYLMLDSTGPWADEARSRLARLQGQASAEAVNDVRPYVNRSGE